MLLSSVLNENKEYRGYTIPQYLIFFEICFVLFERTLTQFGFPHAIIYILDLVNVVLFLFLLKTKFYKQYQPVLYSTLLFILIGSVTAVFNYSTWDSNFLFTALDIRNSIRFLVFFYACVEFLNKKSIQLIFKGLVLFFYINTIYILYQYYSFRPANTRTRGDYLNGFFGLYVGGNFFLNVLFIIVFGYKYYQYLQKETTLVSAVIPMAIAVLLSGLIELKAFFIEAPIIIGWFLFMHLKDKEIWIKTAGFAVFLAVISYLALKIMYMEYPWFENTMTTVEGLTSYVTRTEGYVGSGDYNRFTGFITISDEIFHYDPMQILFGIGLGNASTRELQGASTLFASLYQSKHYAVFSFLYTFVQTGVVGTFLYLFPFIYLLFKKKTNNQYRLVSSMMIVLSFVLFPYSEILKTDGGYLVWFVISCGFIRNTAARTDLKS